MSRKLAFRHPTNFVRLEESLAHEKHPPRNVGAVAASIGRKKYGKKSFEKKARAGKRKKQALRGAR